MNVASPLQQQGWRQGYISRRYLEHATPAELADRTRYATENITVLASDGRIAPRPAITGDPDWGEILFHCREEYRLRGAAPPADFLANANIPKPTYPQPPPIVEALNKSGARPVGPVLVRLGKQEHMRDLHEHGRLRISAASSYADPSLNGAIHDDELKLSAFSLKSEVRISLLDRETGKPRRPIVPLGNVTRTRQSKTDYYVYCLTRALDFRLFGDFGYDACVLLTDPDAFADRLLRAAAVTLSGWAEMSAPVGYVDPYRSKEADMNVFFGKHLRYWYQQEYRFAWLPPRAIAPTLPAFFLELGDLRDISRLIVL